MFLFALVMVHPDYFPKVVVFIDAKSVIMKEVDVDKQFTTEQEFEFRDHMLQRICNEASKLGFDIVLGTTIVGIEELHLWYWDVKEVGRIKLLSRNSNEITPIQKNASVLLSCVVICSNKT